VKPLRRAPLTDEDWAVWLRFEDRPGWYGYSGYVDSDRRDADLMYQREFEKQRAQPFERWEDHRRQWWPVSWGLQ